MVFGLGLPEVSTFQVKNLFRQLVYRRGITDDLSPSQGQVR